MSFINLLFLSDYSNAFSTACTDRLHYVHIFEIADFSVYVPPLIVFGHNVSRWCDVERLAMEAPHALHVSPHVVLAADAPGAGKVVNVLIGVKVFKAGLFE